MRLKYRILITINTYLWATFVLLIFGVFWLYLSLIPALYFCIKGGRKHA
jgi:hypothetical protein